MNGRIHTQFSPLRDDKMTEITNLVETHGMNFDYIAKKVQLNVELTRTVITLYYSHLWTQKLYIPCSILHETDILIPNDLQESCLTSFEGKTWIETFEKLIGGNNELKSRDDTIGFITYWHESVCLSSTEMYGICWKNYY